MELNTLGTIIREELISIPNRFRHVTLDECVVMPNHIHLILIVGATLAVALVNGTDISNRQTSVINDPTVHRAGASPAPTLGNIIGAFKSYCFKRWREYSINHNLPTTYEFWQRNYYDHIIRSDTELERIREYIYLNPNNWDLDEENQKNKQ